MMLTSASELYSVAISLQDTLRNQLHGLQEVVQGLTIIEADELKLLHRQLHWVMMDALKQGFSIQFVDIANAFNPHLLAAIDHSTNLNSILRNIILARPFQLQQSMHVLRTLINQMIFMGNTKQLIIITSLDSQLNENEDKDDLNKQMQYILSSLQNIAVKGNIVIVTNQIRPQLREVFSAHANVHLLLEKMNSKLLKHPYKPVTSYIKCSS
ncbi:MAG: hypothetical protein INQ03_06175 [Candidatus Heimdallarchaeota archaeon]|nr:hypothetical protein [Candidatus Heimdallarchaeota archaeon]